MIDQKQIGLHVPDAVTRREFVTTSLLALGATSLLTPSANASPANNKKNLPVSVKDVMSMILKNIPGTPFKETVDTLKSGNENQQVTGIVTTMFATVDVIRQAIDLKANFIIAHEPTFYNHADDTSWLEKDNVYLFKRNLLQGNSMALWRFHDYLHTWQPDPVLIGVLQAAGWDRYYQEKNPHLITLPPAPLHEIISHLKEKLGISHVRTIGDLSQTGERIALLPGAPGGRRQIQFLQKEQPDLLICGEIQEWETSEYMRDAVASGKKCALVLIGHAFSEEPGMKWLADWLAPRLPSMKITHVPSQEPFVWG